MRVTPCKICGNRTAAIVRRRLRYDIPRNVLRCAECGFIYLAPATGSTRAFYASKKYRATYGPTLHKKSSCAEVFNTYYPFQGEIIKEIARILRPSTKILDLGCSTGHFLAALKGRVGTRVGLELSKDEANFIRKNLDFKVYSVPIEEARINEGPFDLVTAFQVLEHIENPLVFLTHAAKQLKPGGYLYLELPNVNDILLDYYRVPGYADFYYREPHVSYFSKATLGALLRKAGFSGVIGTVQRYNVLNHMHWLLTGSPQGNFITGNRTLELISATDVNLKIKEDFNGFIQRVDEEYKRLVERHGLGESLTFLGKKKT